MGGCGGGITTGGSTLARNWPMKLPGGSNSMTTYVCPVTLAIETPAPTLTDDTHTSCVKCRSTWSGLDGRDQS